MSLAAYRKVAIIAARPARMQHSTSDCVAAPALAATHQASAGVFFGRPLGNGAAWSGAAHSSPRSQWPLSVQKYLLSDDGASGVPNCTEVSAT